MICKIWNVPDSKRIVETELFQDTINSHIKFALKFTRWFAAAKAIKLSDARKIKKIRLIGYSEGNYLSRLLVFGGING